MDHAKHTDYGHLGTSEIRAVSCGDKNLGELHGAEVVGPAAEEGY